MAARAFSVRTGNMNALELALGMAKVLGKGNYVIQLSIKCSLALYLVHRKLGE